MKVPTMSHRDPMELKMTPMIDVVFLLLVFFVWTSSFELPEFDLPSAIAQPPSGADDRSQQASVAEAFDEIVIRLTMKDAAVAIEFNGQLVNDVTVLTSKIRQIISIGVQPPVIVDPDDDITMNVAVQVYDAARLAGADRVLFAADAPQ